MLITETYKSHNKILTKWIIIKDFFNLFNVFQLSSKIICKVLIKTLKYVIFISIRKYAKFKKFKLLDNIILLSSY